MAITFPTSPSLNDTHVVGNVTWTWNGSSWTALAINTASDVNLTGDLIFEGATVDDFEATLTVTDPTADRTVTIPDATGEVVLRQEYGPGTNLYVDLLADTELYWGNTTNIEANDTSIIMKPGNSAVANFESGGLVISTTKTIKNLRNTNVYTTLRFDGTVNDPSNTIDIPKDSGVIPLVNSNGALELPTTNITGTKMESIKFSGTNFDSEIVITEPTAARTITLPDASGTVALLSDISGGGANVTVQDTAPAGTEGDLWWESDVGTLKIYYDSTWVDASPAGSGTGGGGSYADGTISSNFLAFGDDDDLKIFHNGSSSIITETNLSSSLILRSYQDVRLADAGGSETMLKAISHGAVELYHNNVKKLETTATGAEVTGEILYSNVYSQLADLPSATTYHGMFAHVHATGKAYYAHAGNWVELANQADIGGGGSGLQSRGTVTGTTTSLADAAEADLDITGFKAYALLTITTDRAARVRLYVNAATRTADASRAEGVDPTSDAGLIAEVITTGADTVIISPGAYGFNLEGTPTTTIPCRVTNKSGGTSTVQVDLNILQLEA